MCRRADKIFNKDHKDVTPYLDCCVMNFKAPAWWWNDIKAKSYVSIVLTKIENVYRNPCNVLNFMYRFPDPPDSGSSNMASTKLKKQFGAVDPFSKPGFWRKTNFIFCFWMLSIFWRVSLRLDSIPWNKAKIRWFLQSKILLLHRKAMLESGDESRRNQSFDLRPLWRMMK